MRRFVLAFIALVIGISAVSEGADAQPLSGRLKSMAASKMIRVAYRTDAAPFSFLNERNEVVGYTIDLCRLVAASIEDQLGAHGLVVKWMPATTQARFEMVIKNRADLECGASTVTLGRMKDVDFSNYIFVESTGVAVRVASGVEKLRDLNGKKIAVIAGTTNERAMVAKNRQSSLNVTIVQVKDRAAAMAALADASVDAFASDKLLLVGAPFQDTGSLRMLPDDISTEPYAIVLPRGDWALRLAVNSALAGIFRSGEIMKIYDKWFGPIGLRPGLMLGATFALGALAE